MSGGPELTSIPTAPVPPGAESAWLEGAGGLRLRTALFTVPNPVGTVVLSSGRTEFIEKYYEVISDLLARGYAVLTHDWRGQGLSGRLLPDRLKGHAKGFGDFIADHRRLLDHYEPRLPKPWISVSHSMGGCLTMLALAAGERRFAGAVSSAPMLGLKAERNPSLRATVRLMSALSPAAYAPGGPYDPWASTFEGDRLTHERARYDRTHALIEANRELALGAVTWGWIGSAFAAIARLRAGQGLAEIRIPVTIVGAGADLLVDNAGQKRLAHAIARGKYVEIEGAFHEILMETDAIRAVFWREFDEIAAISRTA